MKLSRKCDYALRALVKIAMKGDDEYTSIAEITEDSDIPARYLEQVFLHLKNAGVLSSKAGPGGGYRLRREPSRITLLEIVRLIDGPVAPVRCVSRTAYEPCPHEGDCALRPVMSDVRDAIAEILSGLTLEDACKRAGLVGPAVKK